MSTLLSSMLCRYFYLCYYRVNVNVNINVLLSILSYYFILCYYFVNIRVVIISVYAYFCMLPLGKYLCCRVMFILIVTY